MPDGAHGIADRGGERLVGLAALAARRRAVDRGAHERMAERHATVDAHEALTLGVVEVRERQAEALGGALHRREVADLVGGREQQHAPRGVGQLGHARPEGGLDRATQRRRADDGLDAVELRGAERRREL
jgi:hypothetical protein